MRRLLLLPLIVLFLFSCSTFTSTEGPEWTRVTPHHPGMVTFVGSAEGRDDSSARASAFLNVLEAVGADLGYDAVSPYYRELLSTNRISNLNASVTNTYTSPADEGVAFYVMLEIPEETYYQNRDAEYSASIERTEEISDLLDSALDHYKQNEDTEALTCVLNALDLSLSGPVVDDDFAPDILLEQAIGYLRNIGLSIQKGSYETNVTIRMERMKGMLHPDVTNGLILVRYPMLNGDGNLIEKSVVIRTQQDGKASFFRTNPYMVWKGKLLFSVYVPPELIESIKSKAFEGFLDSFIELLDSKTVVYEYLESSDDFESDTVIAVAEYDVDGVQLDISPAYTSFSSYLNAAEVTGSIVVQGYGETEADVLEFARRAFPAADNYIILRAGIVGSESGAGRVVVRAEARLSFYDATGSEPYIVRDLVTAGGGNDEEEAGESALSRCGSAAAGMFLSFL